MIKNISIFLTIFVVAFVAAGLIVTPALLQDADADRKKSKKGKKSKDFIIDEPVIISVDVKKLKSIVGF